MEASEPSASATPILDRLIPLAPPVAVRWWLPHVAALAIGGAVAVSAAHGRPAIVRRWLTDGWLQWLQDFFEQPPLRAVLTVACAFVVGRIAPLGGHVLAASAFGFRLQPALPGRGRGRLLDAVARGMVTTPMTSEGLASRWAAMVLAGPTASVLSGCFLLLLPLPAAAGWIVILTGLGLLIPFRTRSGRTPGAELWMLLADRPRTERCLALLELDHAFERGVLPEALSQELLAKAIAVRDESPETAAAHALAYSSAIHRGRLADAGRFLETCLRYSRTSPPPMREALMSDAAIWQARRRRRIDLAQQWLADISARSELPWTRTEVEAALLEVRGDVDGALARIDEVERQVRATLAGPRGEMWSTLMERWRAEVRSGAFAPAARAGDRSVS
jgi:hypothetical protein